MITLNLFGLTLTIGKRDPFQFARDLQAELDKCLDKLEPKPYIIQQIESIEAYNQNKLSKIFGVKHRICLECVDPDGFVPRKPNQRYCSRKCASRANGRKNGKDK